MAKESGKPFNPPFYEKLDPSFDSAVPEFMAHDLFGSLIPSGVDPYFLQHVAQRTAAAWAWGNLRAWGMRVLTALELLALVPPAYFSKLAELISITMRDYYGPQKAAFFRRQGRREREKEEEPEIRFTSLFTQYLHDFEGLYGHIASIYAFAKDAVFGGMHACKPAEWYVQQSAKTKAAKLDSPVSLRSGPVAVLIEGYDRHFRNAIAHSRCRFLARETVEMWDMNEKGKETWRAKLSYADSKTRVENLDATIMAMEVAYFLFVMQNQARLSSIQGLPAQEPASDEEFNALICTIAQNSYQLGITDIVRGGGSLYIKAKILPNFDIPQTEEIIVGGQSGARRFEVELSLFKVELPRVVFGFIRNICTVVQALDQLTLEIQDENGQDAGRVVLNGDQLDFLSKADDRRVPVESLPTTENSLSQLRVKFTMRSKPRPKIPKPPTILVPGPKSIIIP